MLVNIKDVADKCKDDIVDFIRINGYNAVIHMIIVNQLAGSGRCLEHIRLSNPEIYGIILKLTGCKLAA